MPHTPFQPFEHVGTGGRLGGGGGEGGWTATLFISPILIPL